MGEAVGEEELSSVELEGENVPVAPFWMRIEADTRYMVGEDGHDALKDLRCFASFGSTYVANS